MTTAIQDDAPEPPVQVLHLETTVRSVFVVTGGDGSEAKTIDQTLSIRKLAPEAFQGACQHLINYREEALRNLRAQQQ